MTPLRSVRSRTTAVAGVVLAAALVAAGWALVAQQRSALTAAIDRSLRQRTDDVLALIDSADGLPRTVAGTTEEGFVQLVSPAGEVLLATPNLADGPALDLGGPAGPRTVTGIPVDDDAFRVLSTAVEDVGTLHVGTTADPVGEAAAALVAALAVTAPVLVVATTALVWWLVGQALRPVERIRAEAADIDVDDLHRRLPDPGTGDEIARLAATMNDLLERVDAAVDRQRRFVADASHDLRTPLTRIRTTLEVDLGAGTSAPSDPAVEALHADVVEVQALVGDLLHLARADSGTLALRREPLDLDDIVLRESAHADDRGIVVVDRSRVSGAHLTGDPRLLARLVRNLLDNAERHGAAHVALSLAETAEQAVLTVTDDGPGIPSADRERVFERFTRLDAARTAGVAGSGLGLAIARDVAVRHGGSLAVVDGTGSGTTVELRLPLEPSGLRQRGSADGQVGRAASDRSMRTASTSPAPEERTS